MIAEILSIGTELLMGQIANTDAQYISGRLSELGIGLYRQQVVGDNPGRVKEALSAALSRADLVITTGGLGPTEDDLTKEMVAEVFGLPMVLDGDSLRAIEAFMGSVGHPMAENNRKQAWFPQGAIILPNACGTAPGCVVEAGEKAVAVLPGPPHELKDMFEKQLAPYLMARSGEHMESRYLRIFGIGESAVENKLRDLFHSDNPTLALYCGPGEVQARITARGEGTGALIGPVADEIRARLGDAVYGEGLDNSIEKVVVGLLRERGETITFAESCTGGMLAARLVDVPGASNVLNEAHVTYADAAKARVLGVKPETLERYTAVSAQCAREMAEGARRVSGATWAAATTGYAGPDGGEDGTPAGTVFIAVSGPDGTTVEERHFKGTRQFVRTVATSWALNAVRLRMEGVGNRD